MNKVYIVVIERHSNSVEIVGVYISHENAVTKLRQLANREDNFDYIDNSTCSYWEGLRSYSVTEYSVN